MKSSDPGAAEQDSELIMDIAQDLTSEIEDVAEAEEQSAVAQTDDETIPDRHLFRAIELCCFDQGPPILRTMIPAQAGAGTKARAFCTCIQGWHPVFDVMMAKEGINVEATKVRAAELIGREDLATPYTSEQQVYLAADEASLLNAPADQRDDGEAPDLLRRNCRCYKSTRYTTA